ncbi:PucR family transcriptional regulator [Sulfobacillus thermosulfidooxidans]|uniref:PucR family transcriptional regulator n=1 Tax=Sulfobacillus thermosulfidooxidans TaxID=28034 RepID=UPI0006B4D9FD|nr:PucR family transcriptional regulator ligand-binding domain-containing protein [Sulfobacillus thermosulfidooxidans]
MTVQDLLQLLPSSFIKVAAGLGGLDREVKLVGIMDAPDIGDWVKPGEFLVTTGYPLHSDVDRFCELIIHLAQAGCAGFGLKMRRYWNEFPEEVRALAKELRFPLIEIAPTINLADIVDAIHIAQKSEATAYLGGSLSLSEFLLRLRNGHLSYAQIRYWANEYRIDLNQPIVAFELKHPMINELPIGRCFEEVFGPDVIVHHTMEQSNLSVGFMSFPHRLTTSLIFNDIPWQWGTLYLGTHGLSLFDYGSSARKAEVTRYVGSVIRPHARVVTYDDIAPFATLRTSLDVERAHSIVEKTILPIAEYDQQHHTDWLPTLAAYFDMGKNAQEAAQVLNTHKNTVMYRLNRIQEHFSWDLSDMPTTFKLYLGLLFYRLQHLPVD